MSIIQKNLVYVIFLLGIAVTAQEKWEAPDSAKHNNNPLSNTVESITNGQKTFKSLCVACHGEFGKGDGVAAAGLIPKPTDFTTSKFQNQTDGEVFWKLAKGKGVMASYEGMLSEKERWEVISYLKSLKTEEQASKETPQNNVKNTFFFTKLINTQTTEVLPNKTDAFAIQHRFGATELNEKFIQDFFGTDLSSNIRLAYAKAINDKMYVELGRTKYGKVYDLGYKYKFLQQTIDNKMPVSMAVYTNIGVSTADFPNIPDNSTFDNGDEFLFTFSHRLSYNTQLIVSKKFSDKFSVQVAPVAIWRNLVAVDEENLNLAIPIGGRYRITNKSAILFEITPKVIAKDKQMPLALAWEIASSSAHAFQIVLASTDTVLEQRIYTKPVYDYNKGIFILGFNLKRMF